MIYINFNRKLLPCISVNDKIFPPVNDFNMLLVT